MTFEHSEGLIQNLFRCVVIQPVKIYGE